MSSLVFEAMPVGAETVNYLVLSGIARPFQIEKDDTSRGGIITEIVEDIFRDSEYTLMSKVFPIARLHHEVNKKAISDWVSYDAKVWNSFGENGVLIDVPLFEVTHSILTCNEHVKHIAAVSDISGWKIATLADFRYLQLDELAKKGAVELVPVNDYVPGILLSEYSRVDGFVEMSIRLKYNVKALAKKSDCQRYVDFSVIIPPYSIYLVVDKNMPVAIKQFISRRLTEMQQSAQLSRIFNKWNRE